MKSILSIAMVLSILGGYLQAREPDIEWQKNFSGIGNASGFSVLQTSDKGYIAAGQTSSESRVRDVYLVKTDSLGNLQWEKTLGGEDEDVAYSIQPTNDGGYILAGWGRELKSPGIFVVKIDSLGNSQWQKTYVKDSTEYGFSIQQTRDGGYIIGGLNPGLGTGYIYIIKTDSLGNFQWDKSFAEARFFWIDFIPIQQTTDGGYIIGDRVLIKTDSLGNLKWEKSFFDQKVCDALCVEQTNDKGYIATGLGASDNTPDDPEEGDVYLLKTDSLGNLQWKNTFGGNDLDYGYWVRQTQDNGYIIVGVTRSYGKATGETYIIKTNSSGNRRWTKRVNLYGAARCVQQTEDGGYIITGYWNNYTDDKVCLYLLKLSPESKK